MINTNGKYPLLILCHLYRFQAILPHVGNVSCHHRMGMRDNVIDHVEGVKSLSPSDNGVLIGCKPSCIHWFDVHRCLHFVCSSSQTLSLNWSACHCVSTSTNAPSHVKNLKTAPVSYAACKQIGSFALVKTRITATPRTPKYLRVPTYCL